MTPLNVYMHLFVSLLYLISLINNLGLFKIKKINKSISILGKCCH